MNVVIRSVVLRRAGMLGLSLMAACGDEDVPGDTLDLAGCEAEGCAIDGEPFPVDGVWLYCSGASAPDGFDAADFDFAAACAEHAPFDPESGSHYFTHGGSVYSGAGQCDGANLTLLDDAQLMETECLEGARKLDFTARLARGEDGAYYRYVYDDYGTDDPADADLAVWVLDERDTTELREGCELVARESAPCEDGGRSVPFGPPGVGEPADLADTDWVDCEYDSEYVSDPPGPSNLAEICAYPLGGGADTAFRFTGQGTFDFLYTADFGVWEADACGQPFGTQAGRFRALWCGSDYLDVYDTPYAIYQVDGVEYFVLSGGRTDAVYVAASAVPGLTLPRGGDDPCAGSRGLDCAFE